MKVVASNATKVFDLNQILFLNILCFRFSCNPQIYIFFKTSDCVCSFNRGMQKLVWRNLSAGVDELYRIVNRSAEVKKLQKFVPELSVKDVTR